MTTREVAQMCGVTEVSVRENAKKFGKQFQNGKPTEWTEDELKKLQLTLLKNQASQGSGAEIVKDNLRQTTGLDTFKWTKEAICDACGVSGSTFDRFLAVSSMTNRDFLVLGSSHKKYYTESVLKNFQLWLLKNQTTQGNGAEVVKDNLKTSLQLGALAQTALSDDRAWEEFVALGNAYREQQNSLIESQKQNQLLLEQYNEEREDNEKNKELVRHMYLSATEVKDKVHAITGKWVVVSKAVRRIPLKDNYVLYKPFKNGNYTGQTAVYHPDVVDLIAESLF